MKKQTSYTIIAFLLGIIIIQYFMGKKQIQQPSRTAEAITEKQSQAAETQTMHATQEKMISASKTTIMVPREQLTFENSQDANAKPQQEVAMPQQPPTKRVVNLTLDEPTIADLERNMNDLSVKVQMRKEDRGWRVSYATEDNPMAATGIRNNDLVLYELIESAKRSPATEALITRLENIFSTLER